MCDARTRYGPPRRRTTSAVRAVVISELLLGPSGGRLYHSYFRTKVRWPELVGKPGWPGLRFHDLRATATVMWIRAKVPLSTVRLLTGHATWRRPTATRGSRETTSRGRLHR